MSENIHSGKCGADYSLPCCFEELESQLAAKDREIADMKANMVSAREHTNEIEAKEKEIASLLKGQKIEHVNHVNAMHVVCKENEKLNSHLSDCRDVFKDIIVLENDAYHQKGTLEEAVCYARESLSRLTREK